MSAPATIDTSLEVTTTKRKLGYIKPLHEFMQLKGKFMRYRMDPTYADVTPNYYEEIKAFIEVYTDIPGHMYWDRLNEEQKLTFCKFLRFSDDMPTQINILCDIDNAKIIIVLNDEAHVTTRTSVIIGPAQVESTEEKGVFGQGQCFGGHKKFCEAYQQLVKKEEEAQNTSAKNIRLRAKEAAKKEAELAEVLARGEFPPEEQPGTVTAYMQKGTFLQISVTDYLEQVLGIERKKSEEELDPETDEQIAGKNAEDMTVDDFKMVAVKRQAKRKLAETMFNFMSKFELIPHNADIISSEFVAKGNINRRVDIDKQMYYVIINGIVCLEARKIDPYRKNKEIFGSINLTRVDPKVDESMDRGENMSSIGMSRKDMKLLRLYPGTILALENDAHTVGTALDPRYAPVPFPGMNALIAARGGGGGRGDSVGAGGLASTSHDSQDNEEERGGGGGGGGRDLKLPAIQTLTPEQMQELERERRKAVAQFERDCVPQYKLQMHFESPCTYLVIPKKLFHSSLKDLPSDASDDILLQLSTSHNLVHSRVAKLAAWIRGDASQGQVLELDLDDDVYEEEIAFRNEEAAKNAPVAESKANEGAGDAIHVDGEDPHDADDEEMSPEDLVKSITLSFAQPSTSPKKKGGQSKFQQEKKLAVSKSTGALPNTRGILKVGVGTVDLGRGRNKNAYDIMKQEMTLKEPLDGTYGEEHIKLCMKQSELPPMTPVSTIVREKLSKAGLQEE